MQNVNSNSHSQRNIDYSDCEGRSPADLPPEHLKSTEALYRAQIDADDQNASHRQRLADCLRLLDRHDEAMYHYARAVQMEPGLLHAWRALAQISTDLGQPDRAIEFWIHLWLLRPAADKDDLDQIVTIVKTGRTKLLKQAVKHITAHYSDDIAALKAVTYVLSTSMLYREAVEVARQALAIEPDSAVFAQHLGYALRQLGHVAESLPYCEAAARGMPTNPQLRYHLGETLLCLGNFSEGWPLNTAFYEIPTNQECLVRFRNPTWNGEPVAGRQILIVGEQGFGDQIQFLRFVDWFAQRGATVDVFVNKPIVELAASMPNVRSAFSTITGVGVEAYDFWIHMGRIPEHIQLDIPMLPMSMPYLTASADKLAIWSPRVEGTRGPGSLSDNRRVGLVWAGNPDMAHNRFRSMSVAQFMPLFDLSGISWFGLQKGNEQTESEAFEGRFDIQTLGPRIEDYGDTLAILQSIDLLITVDSSVAHLAGAAGVPVWTLIPAYTDWRWMTGRTDSPWYPSMRLFRQRELGQWEPVIEEVRQALVEWRAPAAG